MKFSRAESMTQAEDTSRKDEPPSTIHHGSTITSNRLLEGGREPMNQKEGSTMKKLSQNTYQLTTIDAAEYISRAQGESKPHLRPRNQIQLHELQISNKL